MLTSWTLVRVTFSGRLAEPATLTGLASVQVASALFPATPMKILIARPNPPADRVDRALAKLRAKPGLARVINDKLSAQRAR